MRCVVQRDSRLIATLNLEGQDVWDALKKNRLNDQYVITIGTMLTKEKEVMIKICGILIPVHIEFV